VSGLVELRDAQAGVCLRSQLSCIGIDSGHVSSHLDSMRWQVLGPLVVVLHSGPVVRRARRWAVLLNSGHGAALGAWTSLEEWGLRGWERDATHVVVGRGADPPPLPSGLVGPVVVHESRRHRELDVHERHGLRLHSVERSTIDAGAWSSSDRGAGGVLAAAVQQGLTRAERLTDELDQVGPVRRARLMRSLTSDIGGGSQALSEIDVVRFCRDRGLPEPERQVVRRDASGRRRYLDVVWRLAGGRILALEIDGIGHLDPERWYGDLLRTAELVAGGLSQPLRLPATAVRLEPDRIERILRILLGVVRP